jgi:acyl carrier protein
MPTALPDLEIVLADRPDVRGARVLDYGPDGPLIALVQPDGYCSGPELRDLCASQLDPATADRLAVVLSRDLPAGGDPHDPADLLASAGTSYRYELPDTETERRLVALWNEVLLRDRTGVTDDFLDLGGDSLRAVRILTRIEQDFGIRIDIVEFFDTPSVRELGALVDAGAGHCAS